MPRRGNRRSSQSNDTDDYNDLSNFVQDEDFDNFGYDADFEDFGYDEQFDEFGGNPDFDEEDDMRSHNSGSKAKRIFKVGAVALGILAGLLIASLIAYLAWFVPNERTNFISSKNPQVIAIATVQLTGENNNVAFVQVKYLDTKGQWQIACGYVNNATFIMQGDWTKFEGLKVSDSTRGFQWTQINGPFSAAECKFNAVPPEGLQNNTSLNSSQDGVYNFVSTTPVISRLIVAAPRTVSIVAKTTAPHTYDIYLNSDGMVYPVLTK